MKKLIVTMGLLSTIALPLSMVACSSKVETNTSNEYDYVLKVGDVVQISFINNTSDYSVATITRINNIGIMVNNATFLPWTAIKSITLALDNNGDSLK